MKKILVVLCSVLLIALLLAVGSFGRMAERNRQLESSRTALLSGIATYRTRLGESCAEVEQLSLTVKELEQYRARDARTIKDLNIKLRRVEMLSTAAEMTRLSIEMPLHDTIVILDTMQRFAWSDDWTTVSGMIDSGKVKCEVSNIDTLVQIIHRVPRRLWFIRYGTKSVRQQIISRNPHTTVIYTENIEFEH